MESSPCTARVRPHPAHGQAWRLDGRTCGRAGPAGRRSGGGLGGEVFEEWAARVVVAADRPDGPEKALRSLDRDILFEGEPEELGATVVGCGEGRLAKTTEPGLGRRHGDDTEAPETEAALGSPVPPPRVVTQEFAAHAFDGDRPSVLLEEKAGDLPFDLDDGESVGDEWDPQGSAAVCYMDDVGEPGAPRLETQEAEMPHLIEAFEREREVVAAEVMREREERAAAGREPDAPLDGVREELGACTGETEGRGRRVTVKVRGRGKALEEALRDEGLDRLDDVGVVQGEPRGELEGGEKLVAREREEGLHEPRGPGVKKRVLEHSDGVGWAMW